MKKILLLTVVICSLFSASAQISTVYLQASGLTCSMCSNAINQSLQSLPFVKQVSPDIKNSAFVLTFQPNQLIDIDLIKQKVEDAGFAVANFKITLQLNAIDAAKDQHYTVDGRVLHFLNGTGKKLDGMQTVRIVDKGFVSNKEYKKNASFTSMKCYETGAAGDCCTSAGLTKGTRIYHVII